MLGLLSYVVEETPHDEKKDKDTKPEQKLQALIEGGNDSIEDPNLNDQQKQTDEDDKRFKPFENVIPEHQIQEVSKDSVQYLERFTNKNFAIRIPLIISNKYELIDHLGSGSYGVVVLLREKGTDNYYACKIFSVQKMKLLNQYKGMINESKLLSSLDHPNIIKCYGSFEYVDDRNNEYFCILLDYCQKGNLLSILNKGRLDLDIAKRIIKEIALAFQYLFAQGIAHRDLKPENILICSDGRAVLADFGFATTDEYSTELLGTLQYAAPEIVGNILRMPYNTKLSDIWLIGVTFYQIITTRLPYHFEKNNYHINNIMKDLERSLIANIRDTKLQSLLRRCLQRYPTSRISINDIVNEI